MKHLTPQELDQKIVDADVRCSRWLADGNAQRERGNYAKAEECYQKSQFWLDRWNKLKEDRYAQQAKAR